MLELFTRHGAFDLELKCDGDLDVDQHHTVEDVGIALGEAFDRALGDKRGICAPATSSCPWTRPSPSPPST
jgi:imidazoleglycerol-phosphate dehydratase